MDDKTFVLLNVPFRVIKDTEGEAKDGHMEDPYEDKDEHDYVFADPETAMRIADEIAATGAVCEGIHAQRGPDGEMAYMPCGSHDEFMDAMSTVESDSYHEESKKYESINFKPTTAIAREAQRGLDWRKEHNRGGTMVGVARARDLSNRQEVSPSTIRRMVSYFARHEVDKQGEGWSPGEDGYPSAGRIAWALWGGDPGRSWANARKRSMDAEDAKVAEATIEKDAHLEEISDEELDGGVIIEGPVSSGVMDRDGDIVDPAAVMAAWDGYKKNPIILHNHQRGGIGRMVDVRMGEWPGLDHEVPIGRAIIDGSEKSIVHKVRKGIIRAFSIGFIANPDGIQRMTDDDGRVTHRFTSIDWVETSVVDIPSNPMALFDVVKEPMRVLAKGAAPEEFNSPFSMWVFRTGENPMSESPTPEEEVQVKAAEEVVETTEAVQEVVETLPEFVSHEEFKAISEKVDNLIDAVFALKEMSTDPEPVEEDTTELEALQAEIAELKAEKAAAEVEAKIAAEVEARVKSIMGDQPEPVRTPERKSITHIKGSPVPEDAFHALAAERKTSVGNIKGEAWLASLLASRRKQ